MAMTDDYIPYTLRIIGWHHSPTRSCSLLLVNNDNESPALHEIPLIKESTLPQEVVCCCTTASSTIQDVHNHNRRFISLSAYSYSGYGCKDNSRILLSIVCLGV